MEIGILMEVSEIKILFKLQLTKQLLKTVLIFIVNLICWNLLKLLTEITNLWLKMGKMKMKILHLFSKPQHTTLKIKTHSAWENTSRTQWALQFPPPCPSANNQRVQSSTPRVLLPLLINKIFHTVFLLISNTNNSRTSPHLLQDKLYGLIISPQIRGARFRWRPAFWALRPGSRERRKIS